MRTIGRRPDGGFFFRRNRPSGETVEEEDRSVAAEAAVKRPLKKALRSSISYFPRDGAFYVCDLTVPGIRRFVVTDSFAILSPVLGYVLLTARWIQLPLLSPNFIDDFRQILPTRMRALPL